MHLTESSEFALADSSLMALCESVLRALSLSGLLRVQTEITPPSGLDPSTTMSSTVITSSDMVRRTRHIASTYHRTNLLAQWEVGCLAGEGVESASLEWGGGVWRRRLGIRSFLHEEY